MTETSSNTTNSPDQEGFAGALFRNLLAGLTVSFVAISLGAAFGILSGRGAFAGIISAGIIALITALFGGTRIQCSGPTAPMTAVTTLVVAFATTQLAERAPGADPDQFINLVIVLTAGLLILAAVLRLGRFIKVVPTPVISGFMDGIAILIWVDQVMKLFGIGGKEPIGGNLVSNVVVAVVTAVLAFTLPILLKRFLPKSLHFLPATLIAIIVMTVGVQAVKLDIETVSLNTTLNSLDDVAKLVQEQLPREWSTRLVLIGLPFAFQLLLLCYLDTLLTSLVMDKKMEERFGGGERTNQDKELAAQGVATGAVALFGGIPGAQATIRSVLILNEGATMRLAGVSVGIFVIVEMLLFQDYIRMIPQAVFTGILVKVGYDVFDWQPVTAYVKHLWSTEAEKPLVGEVSNIDMFFIACTTLVTVLVNLNVAVVLFSILYYLRPGRRSKAVSETD